jgi:hypothetical protein
MNMQSLTRVLYSRRRAVVGQEFILWSWTLVVCDLFIALYVLSVSFYVLLLGINITTDIVISAILTCVYST